MEFRHLNSKPDREELQPELVPEPLKEPKTVAPLTQGQIKIIEEIVNRYNQIKQDNYERILKEGYKPQPPQYLPEEKKKAILEAFPSFTVANDLSPEKYFFPVRFAVEYFFYRETEGKPLFHSFISNEDTKLIQILRLLEIFENNPTVEGSILWEGVNHFKESHGVSLELRELALAYTAIGKDPTFISKDILDRSYGWDSTWLDTHGASWWRKEIWPYFAENLHHLKEVFYVDGEVSKKQIIGWKGVHPKTRTNAFQILALFPQPPAFFLPLLWDTALKGGKENRRFARQSLESLPDIEVQLIKRLTDRNGSYRAGAAQWLAERKTEGAVGHITKALKKEKNANTKIALIEALEEFGVPEEVYLDRKGLLQEAEKGLRKGIPNALIPFAFSEESLPVVHWSDSGEQVEPRILLWFIVQGYKLKKPKPSTLLLKYTSKFRKEDREMLGQFVLDAWIKRDTSPKYSPDEEEEFIRGLINQYYPSVSPSDYEKYAQEMRDWQKLTGLLAGATKEKGILAVAAACCSGEAARAVKGYLDTYYGWRAAQCKTLLTMLSWVEDYNAVNFLLKTSERFRTPSIRKEAETQVKALAERKGWTLDELTDRTLPTGGFDQNRELELDFGFRKLTAKVTPDMKITLYKEDGKTLKTLSGSGTGGSDELAGQAKKAFTAAKKAVREVKKREKERLYEAMCTQRSWRFEDWNHFLNRHPIMGYLCQKVVWTLYENEESERACASFRPLEDYTLTTTADEELSPEPDTIVRVAHTATLSVDDIKAWKQHFRDYTIAPLFNQFPRGFYSLPEELKEATSLLEFQGYVINGLVLNRMAKRLGYVQGYREDAFFDNYVKNLVGSGLEIHLRFTGTEVYMLDEVVALKELFVARAPGEGESQWSVENRELPLGQVSPILLSEIWHHLKQIAEKGEGFDPEWEKLAP